MTSSLVGSEMCIRDRHRTHYSITKKRTDSAQPSTSKRAPENHSFPTTPCLLYTSDAADDM
eukprot:3321527-Prorocentrum_lima.AAC.1